MATRQYIGARYVPKFADPIEWNNARSYEALEIVTYLGTSYTSKKNVPVGTAITNSEYWVATGNYNAQVQEYVEIVQELAESLKGYSRNKCIFIADSYGNYTNAEGKNFIVKACEYAGIPTSKYYDFHRGSSGFARTGEYSFLDVLQDNESIITDKTEVTDVFVLGGANDQVDANANPFSVATIEAAMADFIAYVKTNYPNAVIRIGDVSKSINSSYYKYATNVLTAYKNCTKYGAVYLDGSEDIMQKFSGFYGDVHPTEDYVNVIAGYVAQLINTNKCEVYNKIKPTITLNSAHELVTNNGADFFATPALTMYQKGSVANVSSDGALSLLSIKFSSAVTLANVQHISGLVMLDDTVFISDGHNNKGWTGICTVYQGSGYSTTTTCTYVAYIPEQLVSDKPVINFFIFTPESISNVYLISFAGNGSVVNF